MKFFDRLFARRRTPGLRGYARTISETAAMVGDGLAQRMAGKRGLNIVDLTWEDTGRFKGSCVGPNISDMTIQVEHGGKVTCMPVIRHPNFADLSCDVSIDDIFVRVGNERGRELKRISLRKYLGNLRRYLSDPGSWKGKQKSLLARREKDVLVSAQACFLPVPREGEATFNPVLFNYQSCEGAPAVLAIVASRQGTSATVIDNTRDAFGAGAAWGQRLFFNADGERASFTGSRLTEFVEAGGDATDGLMDLEQAQGAGLNCVLMIQVPLKQPKPKSWGSFAPLGCPAPAPMAAGAPQSVYRQRAECDVDQAVIGHGDAEGPFTEIDDLKIERDSRFPIRVTVQFYQATSNGVVNAAAMREIANRIDEIYEDAKVIGSLVTEADHGRNTEWNDEGWGKGEPADWWEDFWRKQERAQGKSRHRMMRELEDLLGRRPSRSELRDAVRHIFG